MAPAILMIGLVMSALKQPEFSHLVQELRQRNGLTQTELAAKIGVSYYSVNRWENQRTMPVSLALKRVEEILREMGDLLAQHFVNAVQTCWNNIFLLKIGSSYGSRKPKP